jgi:CRP/FNR family transcriptional regulator
MWLVTAKRRQILFSEGNQASHLYAIRSGKVKLVKVNASGREHVTAVLEPGDMFGFEAVFDSSYTTAAEVLADSELCQGSRDDFRKLMAQIPDFAGDIARYLHHQLCRTRERQMSLGALSASAKLASYIIQSLPDGSDETGHNQMVAHDLTLKELGGILGLSPETVCRVRGDLSAQGVIETSPSGIRVRNLRSLRDLAGV